MKVHKGPLNLSTVSMKNPAEIMKNLLATVEELGFRTTVTSKFSVKCEKNGIKFSSEVNMIENLDNLFTIKLLVRHRFDDSQELFLAADVFPEVFVDEFSLLQVGFSLHAVRVIVVAEKVVVDDDLFFLLIDASCQAPGNSADL